MIWLKELQRETEAGAARGVIKDAAVVLRLSSLVRGKEAIGGSDAVGD
jgi:hypothetical protein